MILTFLMVYLRNNLIRLIKKNILLNDTIQIITKYDNFTQKKFDICIRYLQMSVKNQHSKCAIRTTRKPAK